MVSNVVIPIIQIVIMIAAFLLGKYVWPNVSQETISDVTAKVNLIITYAEKFVTWAKQFLSNSTGSEKMASVVEQLKAICEKYDIDMTEDELKAIAQSAYDTMKAGEESNTKPLTVTVSGSTTDATTTTVVTTGAATTETFVDDEDVADVADGESEEEVELEGEDFECEECKIPPVEEETESTNG